MKTSGRRRALGQHFLSNAAACRQIVTLFAPRPGEWVLEIGPGRGVLTALLLEAGARVVAVEVDERLADLLAARFDGNPSLTLHRADILRCDIEALLPEGSARVLANLPYSITGPILVRLFAASSRVSEMTLMLQKEVVDRILAQPDSRTYGSLSVLAQYFTTPRLLMNLRPGSFTPPPAVDSAVVHMPFRPLRELSADAERTYPAFVRALFVHRRQTLLNNLKAAPCLNGRTPDAIRHILGVAGIDPTRRSETLSREECVRLQTLLT